MGCNQHREVILDNFKKQIESQFEQLENKKKDEKKRLRSKMTSGEEDKGGEGGSKHAAKPDANKRLKKKIIKYEK